eukprot:4846978-Pleurochrysis_carterae.AAC.5
MHAFDAPPAMFDLDAGTQAAAETTTNSQHVCDREEGAESIESVATTASRVPQFLLQRSCR